MPSKTITFFFFFYAMPQQHHSKQPWYLEMGCISHISYFSLNHLKVSEFRKYKTYENIKACCDINIAQSIKITTLSDQV